MGEFNFERFTLFTPSHGRVFALCFHFFCGYCFANVCFVEASMLHLWLTGGSALLEMLHTVCDFSTCIDDHNPHTPQEEKMDKIVVVQRYVEGDEAWEPIPRQVHVTSCEAYAGAWVCPFSKGGDFCKTPLYL